MLFDLDIAYKINTFIDTLPDIQKFFAYIGLCIGIPLLCILLVKASNKIERRKYQKQKEKEGYRKIYKDANIYIKQ